MIKPQNFEAMAKELAIILYCSCFQYDRWRCRQYPKLDISAMKSLPCYSDVNIGVRCWLEHAQMQIEKQSQGGPLC